MKKYISIFLLTSFIGLSIAPAVNITNDIRGPKDLSHQGISWFNRTNLFNMDFTLPYLGYIYYRLGLSISPENTIIGKDGWLFLGDRHAYVISELRGQKPFKRAKLDGFANARSRWDQMVKEQGGIGYFVSVAPNSHTIYREMMPEWAAKANTSPNINYLLHQAKDDNTLIDLSKLIISHKNSSQTPLYYKTDTHWNELGAWYGYEALKNKISITDPSLKWLDRNNIKFKYNERNGGDLSRFLRISPFIKDTEVAVEIKPNSKLHITDWLGKTIRDGDLSDRQENMTHELIINSSNALNNKKVLWLRDSFGIALYPYMNATFSTLMQKHYKEVLEDPCQLKRAIREFKPDLVIITVVERNSLSPFFGNYPKENSVVLEQKELSCKG